jgi:hypothetical protein
LLVVQVAAAGLWDLRITALAVAEELVDLELATPQ